MDDGEEDTFGRETHVLGELAIAFARTIVADEGRALIILQVAIGDVFTRIEGALDVDDRLAGGPVVGDRDALHTDLGAEIVDGEGVVGVVADDTEAVHGGHDAHGVGFFNRTAEGFEVGFAGGLLVHPGRDARAVGFLVIEGKVLVVDVAAVFLDAFDDGRNDFADEDGVFGIVLEGASAIGGTVDVGAGTIKARVASPKGIFAHRVADFLGKFFVEGGRDDRVARVASGLTGIAGGDAFFVMGETIKPSSIGIG